MSFFKSYWNKVKRIGLRENQGVMDNRDVILVNKLMASVPIIMAFYIPVEAYFNGWKMLPATIAMMILMTAPLYFNHKGWFNFTRYYLFIVICVFILIMGILVTREVNNHVSLLPGLLFGMLMFKRSGEKFFALGFVVICYCLHIYLPTVIEPSIILPDEKYKSFTIIFFFLAILLTFLVGYYFVNLNNDYEKIILFQKDSLAAKNKEITDSINYAKRIQTALLPTKQVIHSLLPESFIFYKPKDIVAGDFYWLEPYPGGILIAAADCTGHGVPGAMVSVICNNALNRSVREFNLYDPGKILDKTCEIVVAEFEKSNEEVKDGMDISILNIAIKNGSVSGYTWAGANNPLWYVQHKQIFEIKANKQPIGKTDQTKPFITHKIDFFPDSKFYLFTDGYADQFGGEKNKKLKSAVLKDFIFSISEKSFQEQEKLLLAFYDSWKGNVEQNDDICIIGLNLN